MAKPQSIRLKYQFHASAKVLIPAHATVTYADGTITYEGQSYPFPTAWVKDMAYPADTTAPKPSPIKAYHDNDPELLRALNAMPLVESQAAIVATVSEFTQEPPAKKEAPPARKAEVPAPEALAMPVEALDAGEVVISVKDQLKALQTATVVGAAPANGDDAATLKAWSNYSDNRKKKVIAATGSVDLLDKLLAAENDEAMGKAIQKRLASLKG